MEIQKKLLTRIRLINWHYFENETIGLQGSALVSGENTAGKSTILDAIQLVLTTNTRKFNTAANERGNRDLRGYVRCKVGNIGETYLRKNAVVSNVALEFYEEKSDQYFVLGVHMTSPDEESAVTTKWYQEECRLEDLFFLNGNRPSLQDEFTCHGKKIRYIEQKNAARDRFRRRMGNLEDRFFDIIPKSLAFKPMDHVKDFINKFVLSEAKIDVESLQGNIETLADLEDLMKTSREKLELLDQIMAKYDAVLEKEKEFQVNDLLLLLAYFEFSEDSLEELRNEIRKQGYYLEINEKQEQNITEQRNKIEARLIELKVAMQNNEASRLVEAATRRIEELTRKEKEEQVKEKKLLALAGNLKELLALLEREKILLITREKLDFLLSAEDAKEKGEIFSALHQERKNQLGKIRSQDARVSYQMEQLSGEIEVLQKQLMELEKRKLRYPWYTVKLREAIENEFTVRGIKSRVYVTAELLEVTDEHWQDAVEGYFNTQKFNLIVEPKYYDIALEVYHRNQKEIHTAGIVNTKKIKLEEEVNPASLAYVVHSENRYARAYANYVLGRVIRCDSVSELENHKIAMTADCMLYQGYVARNLDRETYKNPFIGQNAYRVQIVNVRKELEEKSQLRRTFRMEKERWSSILEADSKVNLELMETYLDAPHQMKLCQMEMQKAQAELAEANNDPTYLELSIKIEETQKERQKADQEFKSVIDEISRLKVKKQGLEDKLGKDEAARREKEQEFEQKTEKQENNKAAASEKYALNRKTKTARAVYDNFLPRGTRIANEKEELLHGNGGLWDLQNLFNQKYEQDFVRGTQQIQEYRDARYQLETIQMVKFEEKLRKAKENCEEIFRNEFLAKMKENIENARNEFRSLNKALQNIYYGEDGYRFLITYDKKKESLYRMITSEKNQEGFNLWTEAFEAEYREEIDELFAKLTTRDDKGENVIEEYTDYRSYLDYDIEIHKKNGMIQRFSDIYGEKSGSETQIPYYVAIAASFYQLYRFGNSVRLMLLDEAFDKMDDERIGSMLDFFNSLGLQVIMATPPSKIETIGEKVSTILTAIRVGTRSIVEEYDDIRVE